MYLRGTEDLINLVSPYSKSFFKNGKKYVRERDRERGYILEVKCGETDRMTDRYSVGFRKTIFLEEINFPLQQF